ncbi:leucine-rich repeat-containing protein 31 [Latimeria chalumnae]|uniref:leucine-rich repeat-containing protein 31 n=1 Tax=Latimeria chalumnae TaxID=7897 RepID=UPI00313D6D98
MDSTPKQEGGSSRRSPFDLIMNQLRRKKPFMETNVRSPVTRFFRSSENDKSQGAAMPETKETEEQRSTRPDAETMETTVAVTEESQPVDSEIDSVAGWRKVKQFMQKMGKKPSSKNVNLNNCGLTATDIVELATMMPHLTDLEELDISWNDFIGGTLKPLTLHLQHVSRLKVLKLSSCRLTADDIMALGEGLESLPNLEELDLSWNSDIGGNLSPLTLKIQEGCPLKILRLTDCDLTAEDGKSLAKTLYRVPNLEVLDLSINKNIGSSLRLIAEELRNASRLSVLNLQMCGLKQDGIRALGAAFQSVFELKKLNLSCNKEAGGGFKEAAAQLVNLKQLRVLDLRQCSVTDADMAALTQVIPLLSSLQVLDLSSNRNIGGSSQPLFSRLRFLPKLKSVLINNCALTESSFQALTETVPHLPELETLDLSWNKCVCGNLKLLLKTIESVPALRVLRLSSCNMLADDLAALAAMSQAGHLSKLQTLDLTYNGTIGDEGWTMFFKGLKGLKELSELDISLRPSTCQDCGLWFSDLLLCLTQLSGLTELGMERWILTSSQKERLECFNKENKRSIQFQYYNSTPVSVNVA